MADGGEGNKEGDGSDMRALEGDWKETNLSKETVPQGNG
jgi:hypothetical protein